MILRIVVPGRPQPKARPRVNRNTKQVYTPSSEVEEGVAGAMQAYEGAMFDVGRVAVSMFFYGTKAGTDIDNIAKLYLDALVKAKVIEDDSVVDALWIERRPVDKDGMRAEILLGEWAG